MIDQFLLQADIYHDMILDLKEKMEKTEKIIGEERPSLGDRLEYIFARKELDYKKSLHESYELTELDDFIIQFTDVIIDKDVVLRKIYDSLVVKEDENGDSYLSTQTPGLVKFINSRIENDESEINGLLVKREFELNSITINLCIMLEKFVSKLLKDIYSNELPPFFQNKTLTYEEIMRIDDINLVKEFVIEKQIDELFRKNFEDWFKETAKLLNLDKHNTHWSDRTVRISELFQRRNLIVHTDGIVNGQYLSNVKDSDFLAGDRIEIDTEYLMERLKDLEFLAWFIFDGYLARKEKNLDRSFGLLNTKLLKRVNKASSAIPLLYEYYCNKNFDDPEFKIISQINCLLYYKLNNEIEILNKKLKEFHVLHLNERFVLAKAILDSSPTVLSQIENYFNNLSPEQVFIQSDWPIYRAVEDKKAVLDIINKRILEIIES